MDHARIFYQWHQDWRLGRHTLSLEEQCRIEEAEGYRPDYEVTILGVALWSAARDGACPLGDVTLREAADVCRRIAKAGRLPASLPDIRPGHGLLPPPNELPSVARAVEATLTTHAETPTLAGGPVAPDRLRYRILELRAFPEHFGVGHGGWVSNGQWAEEQRSRKQHELQTGVWTVSEADRVAARATGLCNSPTAASDYPASPKPAESGPSWLQRARRLIHLGTALGTAADYAPRRPDGMHGNMHALAITHGGLCADLEPAVTDLEPLWAEENALDVAQWEQRHVPPLLAQQTAAAEHAVEELAKLLDQVVHDTRE